MVKKWSEKAYRFTARHRRIVTLRTDSNIYTIQYDILIFFSMSRRRTGMDERERGLTIFLGVDLSDFGRTAELKRDEEALYIYRGHEGVSLILGKNVQ